MRQPYGLAADRFGAHIPGMTELVEWLTGTHKCDCGAEYKVTVIKTPTDNAICEKCGTLMDSQSNRSFLAYERISRDDAAMPCQWR